MMMGMASRHCVIGSGGVIIAATIKAMIIAIGRFLESHFGLRRPMWARKVEITGISKIRPVNRSSFVRKVM